MPIRETAPVGAPCWVDLFTSDVPAAVAFYGELFGWTAEEPNQEFGGYFNFQKDGRRIAGCMANPGTDPHAIDMWTVYLAVTDATATEQSIRDHGGQIFAPTMAVGDLGSMIVAADAGGAAVGAWQPGEHKGFQEIAEVGCPAWFEVATRDYQATLDFYRDVFGWDLHTMADDEGFKYSTFGEGDDAKAGIMDASTFLPAGVPAHWAIYFQVDDADKAVAQVVDLGGSVVEEPQDSPFGRLARVADPTGTQFKLTTST